MTGERAEEVLCLFMLVLWTVLFVVVIVRIS